MSRWNYGPRNHLPLPEGSQTHYTARLMVAPVGVGKAHMIAQLRAFAKSWFAAGLIGLLVLSFAVFGVRDVFKGHATNQVIVAGDRSMGGQEFRGEFDRARQGLEKQAGQPVSLEMAVENRIDQRLLDELATRESFGAYLAKIGLKPADELMKAQIEKIPNFFDRISGRFDKALYQQALAQNNLTPDKFESGMRDEIAQSHLVSAIVDGLRVPRAYSALGAIYMTETRDVGYFPLGPSQVAALAPPTDAQLTKFMSENAAQLMRPEYRVLTVVRFSPALAGPAGPVTEAEIQKQFNFRKDTLSKPETRSVIQVPAKTAKAAQDIVTRLGAGEDVDLIAKSTGVEVVRYAEKPRTAIADGKVAAAAFSASSGDVKVVQGDLGFAVIKVIGITPGHTATLAELRPTLEAEARKTAAAEKVYALSQAYDDAHSGGASLPEAAKKAGVPTVTLGPLSAQGGDPQGHPVPGLTEKLVKAAFDLPQGGESEIEDEGQGESFAVRVDKVIPRALPALADIRPRLTQVWMAQQMAKRLQDKANELSARLKKGESLEAVAHSVGAAVSHAAGIDRRTAQQNKEFSPEGLSKIFDAALGDPLTAQNAQSFGMIVGKLEAIRPPNPAQIAQMVEAGRPQMTMALFREIGVDARKAARAEIKPKIYPNVARLALGLEAIDPKAAKAAKPVGKSK